MTPKSLHEMAQIVEENYLQQTTKMADGQRAAETGRYSYRKGAFTAPGGSVNQYQQNSIPTTTSPVECEEIDSDPVMMKLNELMKQAEDDEMVYAIHQLGTLKEFIKGLES